MNTLPQYCKLIEMIRGGLQNSLHVCPFCVCRSNSIHTVRQSDHSVFAQIDDDFRLAVKSVNVPWWMVVRINHKTDAIEPERAHTLIISQARLGFEAEIQECRVQQPFTARQNYRLNNSRSRFVCARLTGISVCFLSSIRNW